MKRVLDSVVITSLVLILSGCSAPQATATPTVPPTPTKTKPPTATSSPMPSFTPTALGGGGMILFASSSGLTGIRSVQPDGSGLTSMVGPENPTGHPEWSPDGTRFAFHSFTSAYGAHVVIMTADGSSRIQITERPGFWQFTWAPDGSHILLKRDDPFAQYIVSSDGLSKVDLTRIDGLPIRLWGWSPDGKKLVGVEDVELIYKEFERDIYTVDADGSNLKNITQAYRDRDILIGQVAWSPSGSTIGFIGMDKSRKRFVYILNSDGSGLKRLYMDPDLYIYGFFWAPDGHTLAVIYSPPVLPNWGLTILSEDGERMADQQWHWPPGHWWPEYAWSPDGRMIAISIGTSNADVAEKDIYVWDYLADEETNLTKTPDRREYDPQWSPDGKRILFFSYEESSIYGAWTINPDGTGLFNVSGELQDAWWARWQPQP